MKAIIKRNLKNYLKNPIFWTGLIVVLISMYQTLAPYLSIHYVKPDETFRKVKMASDGDVMEGCIPATPDKERELWEKEIVKILQDTENGFVYQPYLLRTAWRETADKKCSRWWCGN